jgi:hypothetical protein
MNAPRRVLILASTVITRKKRVIQYSRDASDGIEKPQRTGYFALAGYDDRL